MESCGSTVITSRVITSPTRIVRRALERSGSPTAGLASRRSRSETIPTSRSSSKIGMCLTRRSRQRAKASATLASGERAATIRVIQFRTSSTIIDLPYPVGRAALRSLGNLCQSGGLGLEEHPDAFLWPLENYIPAGAPGLEVG